MIPPTAYITRRFKLKTILISCLIVFLLGSIVSYLSTNIQILIIGRILQAAPTGILMPVTQNVIFRILPEDKWNLFMGLFGLIIGIVPALGPTIGGYIIELYNWKLIFLIFVILSIIVLLLTIGLVNFELETSNYPLDIFSLILSIVACVGILLGLGNIGDYGFDIVYVILPVFIGIISLFLFVSRQKQLSSPLVNMDVLKNKFFVAGTIFCMLLYFTMSAINVIMPIFVQNILELSAITSGLVLLPGILIMILFNFIGPLLSEKIGIRKVLMISCIFSIIGFATMMTYNLNTSTNYMTITQIIRSIGAGLGLTPAITWSMSVISNEVEDATAVNNTARQIFGALGSSIMVVILSLLAKSNIGHNINSVMSFTECSIIMMVIIIISLIIVILYIKDYHKTGVGNK